MKCPICGKEFIKNQFYKHYGLNKHKNVISIYDYYKLIFNDEKIDNIILKYQDGFSLHELKNNIFSRKCLELILKEKDIKIRSLKESMNQERFLEKYKQTCLKKYGVENISQSDEIKKKKSETFIKNYGVDNIFKVDWFNEYVTDLMIKKYNTKRVSGFSNKSEEEKESINKKRFETRIKNNCYDSSLERRVEDIFIKNNIEYKRCFWMYHHPYDFIFGNKILLEINGDYWHANPKIYKENDVLYNNMSAKEIWERDEKFKKCLDNTPFSVVYLWEDDMKKMSDEDILNFLKGFLDEDKKNQ